MHLYLCFVVDLQLFPRFPIVVIIESANFRLKLDEFLKEGSPTFHTNETERNVFRLVREWSNGANNFTFTTSGSTGAPKKIVIDREKIHYSVQSTFEVIDPRNKIKSSLLCINPEFIGGAMVVFRALIKRLHLYIVEPTSTIVASIPENYSSDLVAVVPMQLKEMIPKDVARFKNILVGGGPLEMEDFRDAPSNIFSTYGMTETVSHIALRKIGSEYFQTTGDAEVSLHQDGCLQFQGRITNYEVLKTNDFGEVASAKSFRWIGRSDFVINSGGVKLNPEVIEKKLASEVPSEFVITSIPDGTLGEKVVLLVAGKLSKDIDFSALEKFEKPKAVFENIELKRTASNKIDRNKTRANFINSVL